MKVVQLALSFLLVLLLAGQTNAAGKIPNPTKCNKPLMDSYDIKGSWNLVTDRNMVCPLAKKNCCSYHAQLDIYKKWVMQGEGKRIQKMYLTYSQAISKALFIIHYLCWRNLFGLS